jgi:hypothetical protein
MKTKILVIIITIIMFAFTASAYVPPEFRTEHMNEYETVKVSLIAYDAGVRDRWLMDILEDAVIHNTNSGRSVNNYQQLREWMQKIENQGVTITEFVQPIITKSYDGEGNGWCRGYDKECRKKVN